MIELSLSQLETKIGDMEALRFQECYDLITIIRDLFIPFESQRPTMASRPTPNVTSSPKENVFKDESTIGNEDNLILPLFHKFSELSEALADKFWLYFEFCFAKGGKSFHDKKELLSGCLIMDVLGRRDLVLRKYTDIQLQDFKNKHLANLQVNQGILAFGMQVQTFDS